MSAAATIRVMTFNLRNSRANDGENSWPHRRDLVIETIRAANPDLLGTQESLPDQTDFLRERLADYEHISVGRDDGKQAGEAVPVIIKKSRFDIIDSGTFWLSEYPQTIASKDWDAELPRICTWSRLRVRETKQELLFLNTHFDHRGETARVESAKLLCDWTVQVGANLPAIIVGDFNAGNASDPHHEFLSRNFQDAWIAAHPTPPSEAGTYHGWSGERTRERIDWILHSKQFNVRSCAVDHTIREGKYPSDHFPVIADLRFPVMTNN